MTLCDALLAELDIEAAKTRKVLERLPEDKFGWKPHAKSPTMGWLAGHLGQIPQWAVTIVNENDFDVAPTGAPSAPPPTPKTKKEVLHAFDENVEAACAVVLGSADAHLRQDWTLKSGGKEIFTAPRIEVIRGMVMNHSIHHRAQLALYLRMNDVPVPALYGPSADEAAF